MLMGTRIFVFLVFTAIGLAFVSLLGGLIYEFGGENPLDLSADWLAIATLYSHLFLFFPTLGLFTLYAFFVPASVFVDLYWRHVSFGRLRFIAGALALVALSYQISVVLQQGTPAIWQIAPDVLLQDRGAPEICSPYRPQPAILCASCGAAQPEARNVCRSRQPVLKSVREVRTVSTQSFGLGAFVRSCQASPLLDAAASESGQRYCFVSGRLADADSCCASLQAFNTQMWALYAEPANRSMLHRIHGFTLPVLTFYLLILVVIGGLLVIRRKMVDLHYGIWLERLERGVVLGAIAMVVWPLSNHAFVETSAVLYGTSARSTYVTLAPFFTAVFGLWALMILFYFYRKSEKDIEGAGKAVGVIVSVLTVLNYPDIISFSERFVGAGAGWEALAMLAVLLILASTRISFLQFAKRSAFADERRNL